MDASQPVFDSDDDLDNPQSPQVLPDEALVNLDSIRADSDDLSRPWQENEGIQNQPTSQSASDVATPSPASRKKKRAPQRRAVRSAQRNKRRKTEGGDTALQKLCFSREMTARIMDLFLDETRAGNLKDAKWSFQRPAMERILNRMKTEYPRYQWEIQKIKDKYANERRRYRLLLTFLAISGISYDDGTGLPQAPDIIWDAFLAKHPTGSWLRSTSIGRRAVYQEVFHDEKATGRYVKEARKLASQACLHLDSDLEDVDISAVEDSGGDTDMDDPDENSDIDDDEAVVDSSSLSSTPWKERRRREKTRESAFRAIASGIERLAKSNAAATKVVFDVPGADDMRLAIKDFQDNFVGEFEISDMVKVINKLASPTWALVWNSLSREVKAEYAKQWVRE
ncbi:hypothetical protein MMYC01_207815 [Madurella mycetomatis]|uniref:Myb/SANT-like domain-containing protein n=1 Tax=Madurella mycetomatis TaxID=100816 RepID=A0A175VWY7_9PEZI|nr:hypothetical protein MMYC01_207815 [Madurella mycetomatis]